MRIVLPVILMALWGCAPLRFPPAESPAWEVRGVVLDVTPTDVHVRHKSGRTFGFSRAGGTRYVRDGRPTPGEALQKNQRVRVRARFRGGVLVADEITFF